MDDGNDNDGNKKKYLMTNIGYRCYCVCESTNAPRNVPTGTVFPCDKPTVLMDTIKG
jgi:hypothetical protein